MDNIWYLSSCLFVTLISQSLADLWLPDPLSAVERYLYAELEGALVNDAATLEQLREVFFQEPPRPNKIQIHIDITVDSIPASNCSACLPWLCQPAFCPVNNTTSNSSTSMAQWRLCSHMNVTWSVPPDVDALDLIQALTITVVPWCTHGLSIVVLFTSDPAGALRLADGYLYDDSLLQVTEPIRLFVKKLHCHPFASQLTDAVGQLFSWIEVYTKSGGKPQGWNPQQQAMVQVNQSPLTRGTYWLIEYFDWKDSLKPLHAFGMAGCFLLTLSLLLLIPRLFLMYHNKLIHNRTTPGSRSLYWGTAVVSLLLVSIIILAEIFVPCLFVVISIIASRSSRAVPLPAAKFTTHVLFCCCCCFCCSSRHKSKGVQVLTLWAFMTFIYYHITEAIALVFTLFFSVPLTISYALMYVSGVFFAIMLISIILFSCQSTGRSKSISAKCLGLVDVCATFFSFSFVLLVFVAFVAMFPIFSHLQVKGFESASLKFSLLPSLALSVAGWLIRKKLLKEGGHRVQPAHPTHHGATGHLLNDGERVNESSEEDEHIIV